MKKHKDLVDLLRANGMRITAGRKLLLQYIIDNRTRQISLKEIHRYLSDRLAGVVPSSVYRNLDTMKKLDILQELTLPKLGKCFQYVFDKKVRHFFICKSCGKSHKGNDELFSRIECALKDLHGFSKANLSAVFYGYCSKCGKPTTA